MNTQADKTQENKGQSVANGVSQKQSSGESTFQFVDNRPEAVAQRKLQEIVNNSPRMLQLKALQEKANNNQVSSLKSPNEGVVQRAIEPNYELRPGSVVVEDHGFVSEYINGDAAGNFGWIGVEKYKAGVKVGENVLESPTYDNNFRAAEAGHVLASQNGGLGSHWPNVFAQDGGVNNGPFRGDFENPMRRLLNNAEQDEDVHFRAVLYGDNIEPGVFNRRGDELERSDEDTDHEW
jgi:hypothetical protein